MIKNLKEWIEKFQLSLNLTQDNICRSVEVLKEYNPKYRTREIEYYAEFLFQKATKHWNTEIALYDIIAALFSGLKLTANIFDDTVPVITELKKCGLKAAVLTNLPSSIQNICTAEELRAAGGKDAFLRLKLHYPNVCLVHLYTLQGAIDDVEYYQSGTLWNGEDREGKKED